MEIISYTAILDLFKSYVTPLDYYSILTMGSVLQRWNIVVGVRNSRIIQLMQKKNTVPVMSEYV